MNKVTDIRDKQPKKPLTPEEIAERAYKEHFKKTKVEDEPESLASGKAGKDGGFVHENDEGEDDDR